ncbi:MAG: menaquinone biosynthesis protein [Bacteroidetes bacterium]|nr:menaquinone biosynthesis protein [Bacteroidota bacterium]
MEKIKISCVSYLNSKPFIYGLTESEIKNEIDLQLDIPSVCAEKLEGNRVDIGLVPVAILPELEEYHIISNYCIGADGEVKSVLLLSDVPLAEIKNILLDHQSRTSVMLVRVLAEKFWKISPNWKDAEEKFEDQIHGTTAGVVIGDRTFTLSSQFNYCYDLSAEWKKFTRLPFVFACWVANKKLSEDFIARLNDSLGMGLQHISEVIRQCEKEFPFFDMEDYFTKRISYVLDEDKKKSLQLFLKYMTEMMESDLLKIV